MNRNNSIDTSSRTGVLRLLQLVPEPLPTFRVDVAVLFGKYLPRHQIECHLVGMAGVGEIKNQGFASTRCSATGGRLWRELSHALLCLRVLLACSRKSIDVIQVRDMVPIGLLAMLIARLKGVPFVYWMSYLMCEGRIERARASIAEGGGLRSRLVLVKGLVERAVLYRVVLPGADHVFAQSDAMKSLMVARGAKASKLTAVPMGVDAETLTPGSVTARRLPGWENVPVIAYLGTLNRLRCLHQVIDALQLVRLQHPRARLLLIGDAARPDVAELRAHAAKQGLGDAVHITGWLASCEALPLLAGADVAVSFIPRGEILDTSSPTKLLEYLAIGLPCVGNDNPDQVQVLSRSNAGVLTGSSTGAMARALTDVLVDPVAARKRAAAGPAFIDSTRSYRILAAMVATAYQAIVAKEHR